MCFFLEQDSKPLIAPEGGIECFKIVCPTYTLGEYSSLFRCFLYQKLEQCPEIPLVIEERRNGLFTIEAGYHSYRSIEMCRQEQGNCPWKAITVVVRCLIPAGSQYYQNLEHDEYVSSSIILLGEEL